MVSVFSLLIPTLMMRGTWSEGFQMSGSKMCLPNSGLSDARKTRSRTKLVS